MRGSFIDSGPPMTISRSPGSWGSPFFGTRWHSIEMPCFMSADAKAQGLQRGRVSGTPRALTPSDNPIRLRQHDCREIPPFRWPLQVKVWESMDTSSKKKRSWVMSQVKSTGNKSTEQHPIAGLREYRIKGWRRSYPLFGKPDFVSPKAMAAVFVESGSYC